MRAPKFKRKRLKKLKRAKFGYKKVCQTEKSKNPLIVHEELKFYFNQFTLTFDIERLNFNRRRT